MGILGKGKNLARKFTPQEKKDDESNADRALETSISASVTSLAGKSAPSAASISSVVFTDDDYQAKMHQVTEEEDDYEAIGATIVHVGHGSATVINERIDNFGSVSSIALFDATPPRSAPHSLSEKSPESIVSTSAVLNQGQKVTPSPKALYLLTGQRAVSSPVNKTQQLLSYEFGMEEDE